MDKDQLGRKATVSMWFDFIHTHTHTHKKTLWKKILRRKKDTSFNLQVTQNVRLTWHRSKSEAKMIELMMGQNQNQRSTIKPE